MENLTLLNVANYILKSNNYRFEFKSISPVELNASEIESLYFMGSINEVQLLYTMESIPTNFVNYQDKYFVLF